MTEVPHDDPHHPPLALGYHALSRGTIATIVTYLQMTAPPDPPPTPANAGLALRRMDADLRAYRELFRAVGEDWLWTSRLEMTDAALSKILSDPKVEVYALMDREKRAGLLELDFRREGACELTFFGLVPDAIGKGAGRYLMSEAIAKAWSRPIKRFWLHTCTQDSPAALSFYQRSGFRAYAQAVEVVHDPRLDGTSPRHVAPHVLLVDTD